MFLRAFYGCVPFSGFSADCDYGRWCGGYYLCSFAQRFTSSLKLYLFYSVLGRYGAGRKSETERSEDRWHIMSRLFLYPLCFLLVALVFGIWVKPIRLLAIPYLRAQASRFLVLIGERYLINVAAHSCSAFYCFGYLNALIQNGCRGLGDVVAFFTIVSTCDIEPSLRQ